MIYLIEGDDYFLVKQKINEIIKQEKIEIDNIFNFNKNSDFSTVINALISASFFSEKKAVIYEDPIFFNSEQYQDWILNYLENENKEIVLILYQKNLDKRKKIISHFKQNTKYLEIINITEKTKENYVTTLIKKYNIKIEKDAIQLLLNFLPLDAGIIENEIVKLSLLEELITVSTIEQFSTQYFDENMFSFVDTFLNGTRKQRLQHFEKIANNQNAFLIIGALASKLRLLYQVAYFSKNYNEDQLMKLLDAKRYPIQLAYRFTNNYDPQYFLKLLNELSVLTYKIRHGFIEAHLGLSLFILKKGIL